MKPIILIASLAAAPAVAADFNEAFYADAWCLTQGGESEVTLPSGGRVDCLTVE